MSLGQDMDDQTSPFQVNLGFQVPDDKDADYIGKAELERQREAIEAGEFPFTHKLVGLKMAGEPIRDYPPDFWLVSDPETGEECGYLTSAWWNTELEANLGLAYVPAETLQAVTTPEALIELQGAVRRIRVEDSVREYVVKVARATRDHPAVSLGVSPRGTMALYQTAQALAAIRGRDYVIPDDVKELAPHALTHRIIINPQTRLRGRTPQEVVMDVVDQVPVPVETL